MADDTIICNYDEIYKSTIGEVIKWKGLETVEEAGEATEAGTVCGQYEDDIQAILDEINK
jgi:bacterioferritin-associated ferredoxin